jgi:hypothetical protein
MESHPLSIRFPGPSPVSMLCGLVALTRALQCVLSEVRQTLKLDEVFEN